MRPGSLWPKCPRCETWTSSWRLQLLGPERYGRAIISRYVNHKHVCLYTGNLTAFAAADAASACPVSLILLRETSLFIRFMTVCVPDKLLKVDPSVYVVVHETQGKTFYRRAYIQIGLAAFLASFRARARGRSQKAASSCCCVQGVYVWDSLLGQGCNFPPPPFSNLAFCSVVVCPMKLRIYRKTFWPSFLFPCSTQQTTILKLFCCINTYTSSLLTKSLSLLSPAMCCK